MLDVELVQILSPNESAKCSALVDDVQQTERADEFPWWTGRRDWPRPLAALERYGHMSVTVIGPGMNRKPSSTHAQQFATRSLRLRFGITLDLTGSFGITLRPCETAIYQKGVPDRISIGGEMVIFKSRNQLQSATQRKVTMLL